MNTKNNEIHMETNSSSLKILCFFSVTIGALFATLAVMILWMFAYMGGNGILELDPQAANTVLGSLGISFITILIGASGQFLLLAIWVFYLYAISQIFREEISESLNSIKKWWNTHNF